jgi:hypothetical protein
MGEHAQHLFGGQRQAAARGKRGAEPSLVPGKDALDLLPLGVQGAGKGAPHGPAIRRARPAAGGARIEGHRGRGHPQLLAAEPVHVFRIVARIGGGGREADQPGGLAQHRGQGGGVMRRPPAGQRPDNQVRAGVDDDRQLGVTGPRMGRRRAGAGMELGIGGAVGGGVSIAIVGAGVPGVEPGGVYRGNRPRGEETTPGSAGDADLLDLAEGPPFSAPASSRCAA